MPFINNIVNQSKSEFYRFSALSQRKKQPSKKPRDEAKRDLLMRLTMKRIESQFDIAKFPFSKQGD
jgi:hypothetical protein